MISRAQPRIRSHGFVSDDQVRTSQEAIHPGTTPTQTRLTLKVPRTCQACDTKTCCVRYGIHTLYKECLVHLTNQCGTNVHHGHSTDITLYPPSESTSSLGHINLGIGLIPLLTPRIPRHNIVRFAPLTHDFVFGDLTRAS